MRPYNTRHKTLSLHSLGIHVPGSGPARAATASRTSPASSCHSHSNHSNSSASSLTPKDDQPPAKRQKRAHSESSDTAPALDRLPKKRDDVAANRKYENTPPPSPPADVERPSIETDDTPAPRPIDMSSINDEIVEAVIVQLQKSRNRPHLVKELATILMPQLKIVQQSANPCAIISSRLSAFLKRPGWSTDSPCPLAKELESVHPRRTYFYLTTCPRQPLPDPAQATSVPSRSIISPSPSSSSADDSSDDLERRRELSPSPEVDLSSPELDDIDDDFTMPGTPIGSFTMRGGYYMPSRHHQSGSNRIHIHRSASPPLEKDEKEFTQTADGLQKRKLNGDNMSSLLDVQGPPSAGATGSSIMIDLERDDPFGVASIPPPSSSTNFLLSSPAIRPASAAAASSNVSSVSFGKKDSDMMIMSGVDGSWARLDGMLEWDRSPENIELEELDGLLDDY